MTLRSTVACLVMAVALAACSSEQAETIPQGHATSKIKTDLRGYEAPAGVIVGRDVEAHWVQKALAGYRQTSDEDLPARVTMVANMRGCRLARPGAEVHLANVHVGSGRLRTPVHAWSRRETNERTKKFISAYKQVGEEARIGSYGDSLSGVDVVVTETEKPVYLMLQYEGSVLFNVHAAPGAQIAQVAVIGRGDGGVANLDPSVPVTFLTGKAAARCKAGVSRKPDDHWRFVKRAKAQRGSMDDILQENIDRYRAYDKWFQANFGTGSEDDVIGIERVGHVLVGPLPAALEQRVAFRPLAGAEVLLSQQDHVTVASREEQKKTMRELIRATAEKAVGGDLKTIAPQG